MRKVKCLLVALVLLLSILPAYEAAAATQDSLMTVKLKNYLKDTTSITVTSNGTYQLDDGNAFIKSGEEIQVKVESGQLVVYKDSKQMGEYDTFSISPVDSESLLYINSRSYQGSFQFTVESEKYVRPLNTIPIEEYLQGVVPNEMYASWHIEALKAQAIAARTYALRNQSRVIDDTVSYQVYGGAEGHPRSNQAISETTGIVLKYNNRLIDAVFSASNGGMTELNSNAWSGSEKLPYFAIQEDPFDLKANIVWSITIDRKQIDLTGKDLSKPNDWWASVSEKDTTIVPNIKAWLKNNGYSNKDIKITDIPILSVSEKTSGGRVTKGSIQINFYVKDLVDEKGALVPKTIQFTDVAASKIRAIVGANKMKSYLVDESTATADKILITGRGYGHGVGLSQHGASNRADAGQTYEEILQFYYPGTTLVKEYSEVVEDTTAPNITDVAATTDYNTSKVNVAYTMDEESIVTVNIKGQDGKTIVTPVNESAVPGGSHSTTWDIKNISDGTYTVFITAKDSNQNINIVTSPVTVKKPVLSTMNITNVAVTADYSTEKAKIAYKLSENAIVTVTVKDSKGKVIATPVKQQSLKKGSRAQSWTFAKNSNGTYKVTITATNSKQQTKTTTKALQIKRTTGKVTATVLNVRNNKTTSSKIIAKLKKNQTVTILAKESSWYKIKVNNTIGYVAAKYVK